MRLSRSIAPLLNAAVGALALMVPVPTTGASVAELAPLPPTVMLASIERVDKDDAALIASVRQREPPCCACKPPVAPKLELAVTPPRYGSAWRLRRAPRGRVRTSLSRSEVMVMKWLPASWPTLLAKRTPP